MRFRFRWTDWKILPGNIVSPSSPFTSDESPNSISVKIDATPPQLVLGTAVFSTQDTLNDDDPDLTRTNTLLAKNGEAIYFDFETNERIESPSVTINGEYVFRCDQWCFQPCGQHRDSTSDGKMFRCCFLESRAEKRRGDLRTRV